MKNYENYKLELYTLLCKKCEESKVEFESFINSLPKKDKETTQKLFKNRTNEDCANGKIQVIEMALVQHHNYLPMLLVTSVSSVARNFIKALLDNQKTTYKNIWITNEMKITKIGLYNLLYENNDSNVNIIFENDKAFKQKNIIEVLDGAICSSPDSGSRWPVRIDDKSDFIFKGRVVLLTELDYGYLKRHKKYYYLLRDTFRHDCN